MKTIKELYIMSDCNTVADFCDKYHLKTKTVYCWLNGSRKPPDYVLYLLEEAIKNNMIKDVL